MYKVNLMEMEIGVESGCSVYDVIKKYSSEEYDIGNIIACKVNNKLQDLNYIIEKDCDISYIFTNSTEGMRIYVRGLTLLLIKALHDAYPNASLKVDYSLGEALCCRIEGINIVDEIVVDLRNRMKQLIMQNISIERKVLSIEEIKKIYNDMGFNKKAKIVEEMKTKSLSLYYLDDVFGYFYGKMPISTSYISVFDLKKYENGVIIMYPTRYDTNIIKSVNMPKKLSRTFSEYQDFYETVGIKDIYDLNQCIKNDNISKVIMITEAMHEKKIANIADMICKNGHRKLVLIAGPSSSGKTTFAQRLGVQLSVNKVEYVTLSMDNYFIERDKLIYMQDGQKDYESLQAVDVELLNENICKLLNKEEVLLPRYDFITGKRVYDLGISKLSDSGIILLEGIHALNDELIFNIPSEQKYRIFVSALTVLNVDDYNRISTTDTRLMRRIIRDSKYRDYSIEQTMQMWEQVRKGEDKYIFPYQENADVMFNTSLPYEFSIYKNEIEELFSSISKDSPYYAEINRISSLMTMFLSCQDDFIPKNSILREFIGGGCFYR